MPSQESVSLLLINEQAEEVKLTTISIRGFYPGCRVETVYSAADALEWSSRDDWHVILLDEHLAHGKESFLLPELKKRAPHAALIVQAERSDTTVAMQVMHAGADYYLFKESPAFLSELLIVTRKAVEQRELHRRLDLTEERYLRLLETMTDIAYELDASGNFRFVSPLVKVVLGYAPEDLVGRHFSNLLRPEERGAAERRFNERRTGGRSSRNLELRLLPKDACAGSMIDVVEINATGLYDRHKQYVGTLGVIRSRARLVPLHLAPPALESPDVPARPPDAQAPQNAVEQPSGPDQKSAPADHGVIQPAQDFDYLERRRSPRLKVQIGTRVTLDGMAWDGWTTDLSLGGMFLQVAGAVPVKERQPIQLGVVSDVGVLELRGWVRAVREAGVGDQVVLGLAVQLGALEPSDTKILASLLVGLREGSISLTLTALLMPQETGDLLIEVNASGSLQDTRSIHPCADAPGTRERRVAPRVSLALPVEFIASEGPAGRQRGVTINLGLGGLCLQLPGPSQPAARRLLLRLLSPSHEPGLRPTAGEIAACTVMGELVWTGPEPMGAMMVPSRASMRTGLRFVQLSEETRRRIADLVARSLIAPVPSEERTEGSRIVSLPLAHRNRHGERIALYHDHVKEPLPSGTPVIILLPAYGETKKEYITLAYYFAANGFHVLRYDHTHHVGESDGDITHSTLTRMKEDLLAVLDYAGCTWPSTSVGIVATSLAGRVALKACAEDDRPNLLVLLTGVVDVQSTLLAVHQEDLIGTYLDGVRRGVINMLGFNIDADGWLQDATAGGFADLDSTVKDASALRMPVVMFAAEQDAWVVLESVQVVQRALRPSLKHFYLIPEALHRLHENPRKARAVFRQLVHCCIQALAPSRSAQEIVEPHQREIGLQNRVERERARAKNQMAKAENLAFWKDYLEHFHYIANVSDFWQLLDHVYRMLGPLKGGELILDAGCGNGNFGMFLLVNQSYRQRASSPAGEPLQYIGLDFVPSALRQSRDNLKTLSAEIAGRQPNPFSTPLMVSALSRADLNSPLPFPDNQFDRIVCNLVLAYLQDPLSTLREFMRVLAWGGKLVLTNLKPQSDLSQIYRNFIGTTNRPEEVEEGRRLLSNSAKIKQGESEGIFRFFDRQELATLLVSVGVSQPRIYSTFANQAYIAVAEKGPAPEAPDHPAAERSTELRARP